MKQEFTTPNHGKSPNWGDHDALAARSTRNERVRRKRLRIRLSPFCLGSIIALGAVTPIGIAAYVVFSGAHNKPYVVTAPAGQSLGSERPEALRFISWASVNTPVEPAHLVYPYSVIPGGIHSAAELRQAVARDTTVAQHYARFEVSDAQVVTLDRHQAMYVSYRLGNRIYWTRRKLSLLKGEKLMTDGVSSARVRCGNRLSKVPRSPISLREPPPRDLEGPPAPTERVPSEVGNPHPVKELISATTLSWGNFGGLPLPPATGTVIAAVPGRGGGTGGGGGTPSGGVTPPPLPTPEPGTLALLSSAIPLVYFIRGRAKSRRRPRDPARLPTV